MVQFNFFRREVRLKVVFYGPGFSGKTTNMEVLHGKKICCDHGRHIAIEQDRTLFFYYYSPDLGTIADMETKWFFIAVPGQVFYNSTRKLILQGTDGVIFVADSQANKREENKESWLNLWENLKEHGVENNKIPVALQLNKRDMPHIMPVEQMVKDLNYTQGGVFEAIATTGEGVFSTFKWVAQKILKDVNKSVQEAPSKSSSPKTPYPRKPQVFHPAKRVGPPLFKKLANKEAKELTDKENQKPHN